MFRETFVQEPPIFPLTCLTVVSLTGYSDNIITLYCDFMKIQRGKKEKDKRKIFEDNEYSEIKI